MVKIRLTKTGSKNQRKFRIVVTQARSKRNGKSLEILGFFLPEEGGKFNINFARYNFWLLRGAQPSKAVLKLISENEPKRK